MQQGVAPCVSSICTVGPSLSPTRCKAPVLPDGMRPPPAHGCGGAVCYWPTPQQEPWGQVSSHLWVSCSQQGLVAISPFTGSCPHPSQEISSLSSGTPFSHLQDLPKACPDPFQPTPVTPLPRESRAVSVTAGSQLHPPSPSHASGPGSQWECPSRSLYGGLPGSRLPYWA